MPIVLVEPQIPQNTGSIARTCAALQTSLHIVEPIPFEISEKRVRRAGLDYWPHVDLRMHKDWESFLETARPQNLWCLSTKGTRNYFDAPLAFEDFFVFGSETQGLGQAFLDKVDPSRVLSIPMYSPSVRSLNLSNAVSIVIYEAVRRRERTQL